MGSKSTTARAGGEYIAFLMTRCGCTRVMKMTGANPPQRIHLPMVRRMSEVSPLVTASGAPIVPSQDENVRTFVLNEGAQEELFGMDAFQYLEVLP